MLYNRAMPRLDILLPFALPPAELAADLRKQLDTPALATLAGRAARRHAESIDEFARALPHEAWLARRFGLPAKTDTSPPLAAVLMRKYGLDAGEGLWFILHPVHLHVARDHLVLTDRQRLELDECEARTLFDIARPLFEEYGKTLLYGDAATWFMRADEWGDLSTATPDAATGHNVDLWMPRGTGERDWRKLQNEVQMHWFMHPLNAEREARGALPVNSLWLWGAAPGERAIASGHGALYVAGAGSRLPWPATATPVHHAGELAASAGGDALLNLETLVAPALEADWGRWLEELHTLERNWFAPLLEQLRGGTCEAIGLIASGDRRLLQLDTTRASLRKFWRRPSLDSLLS